MVSLLGADRPPEASCMADKARSAFFKALLRVLSFPAVSTFSENLFARGGLGPIGVFSVGPLHDRTGSGHPDDPDSSFFSLNQNGTQPERRDGQRMKKSIRTSRP